jgi:NlpC/P60 family putative phage cell wall peptidase
MKREDIVTEARRWIGTRWQHQASARGLATDCIGFVAGVALELGSREAMAFMARPDLLSYGRQPDPTMLLRVASDLLDPIEREAARPGDILLMRFNAGPQHFGFLSTLAPDYMIHAYAGARRVVEHGIDAVWRSRIVGAYAMRGVEA